MIPLSGGVLTAAAVVSSPALWGGLEGTMPIDQALTRYLIAVAVCWLVLAIVIDLTFPSSGSSSGAVRVRSEQHPADQDFENL